MPGSGGGGDDDWGALIPCLPDGYLVLGGKYGGGSRSTELGIGRCTMWVTTVNTTAIES